MQRHFSRNFHRRPQDDLKFKYNRNDYIRAQRLLVVTDEGEKLGEMSKQEAMAIAYEQEKDLVEIAPQANPPVAKIISWSKFKYEHEKKEKANKHKSQEQKEIWFKAFISDGDIEHKLKKVREFIDKKNTVKLTIRRKGRVNPQTMQDLMKRLVVLAGEFATILSEPKYNGGNLSMIVGPKKN